MRVTVDIDDSELLSLMAFYNMRYRYSQTPKIHRTGQGGVHLIARDLPLSWYEANEERRLFKDDEGRIWLDIKCQGKPQQALHCINIHSMERFPMDERTLLALPFWRSKIVRKTRA